jgi:hypothetical protein
VQPVEQGATCGAAVLQPHCHPVHRPAAMEVMLHGVLHRLEPVPGLQPGETVRYVATPVTTQLPATHVQQPLAAPAVFAQPLAPHHAPHFMPQVQQPRTAHSQLQSAAPHLEPPQAHATAPPQGHGQPPPDMVLSHLERESASDAAQVEAGGESAKKRHRSGEGGMAGRTCIFWTSATGCFNGNECAFVHEGEGRIAKRGRRGGRGNRGRGFGRGGGQRRGE